MSQIYHLDGKEYQYYNDQWFEPGVFVPVPKIIENRLNIYFPRVRKSINAQNLEFEEEDSFSYETHCWKCGDEINSGKDEFCTNCKRYICSSCGYCMCKHREDIEEEDDDESFLHDI